MVRLNMVWLPVVDMVILVAHAVHHRVGYMVQVPRAVLKKHRAIYPRVIYHGRIALALMYVVKILTLQIKMGACVPIYYFPHAVPMTNSATNGMDSFVIFSMADFILWANSSANSDLHSKTISS